MMMLVEKIKNSLKLSDTHCRIIQNVFWAMCGKMFTLASQSVIGIFIARYLGPAQYGIMSYVISYVTLFTILASFGLDYIEIRELAYRKEERDDIMKTVFYGRCFFSVAVVLLIMGILCFTQPGRQVATLIMIYSISLVFSSFNVIRNYFTAMVDNKHIAQSEICRSLLGAITKVILLILAAPLIWFIVALVFDFFILALGYLSIYLKTNHLNIFALPGKFNGEILKYLLRESWPLLLSHSIVIAYQKIDQIMVYDMLNSRAAGLYGAAMQIVDLATFIPTIISLTLMPLLKISYETDSAEYDKRRLFFLDLSFWGSFILTIGICCVGYWIFALLYGKAYLGVVPVFQIMIWKVIGSTMSSTSGQLIIIEGVQKYAIIRNLGACVICIIANKLLIPTLGLTGASLVAVITAFFAGFISNLFIPRYRLYFNLQCNSILRGWKRLLVSCGNHFGYPSVSA